MNLNLSKFEGVAKLPLLHISLYFEEQTLIKISLSHAREFALECIGPPYKEEEILHWFTAYFQGDPPPFPLPLDSSDLGPFTGQVLEELQRIPFGEKRSYGTIAKKLGSPNAARAVGNACRTNPFPFVIPCHRVVASSGGLGGFAYGLEMKKDLLELEEAILKAQKAHVLG